MSTTASKYGTCAACMRPIGNSLNLKCCQCSKTYDIACVRVSEKRFLNTMTAYHKNNWQCEECKGKVPKTDNTETPVRQSDCNITLRNRPNTKQSSAPPITPEPTIEDTSHDLIAELRLLREEMKAARVEMQEFRNTISNLTVGVEMCNRRIDELAVRIDVVEQRRCSEITETGNLSTLEKTISDLKSDLNERDQELLRNDIDVVGILEEKNENCIHLALTVAQKLGITLEERDVVSASRAGNLRRLATNEEGPPPGLRPRPLVVRLTRRELRDRVLAAARVRRGTTTAAGLGTASNLQPLYVNESLTPVNRRVFYMARKESLRAQWKYVWTRDGKIFARKEQGSPRFQLRTDADISKVFGLN